MEAKIRTKDFAAKIIDLGNPVTIPTGAGNEIRVAIKEMNGKRYIDVRVFYQDKVTKNMIPTTKGIWIPVVFGEKVGGAIFEQLVSVMDMK